MSMILITIEILWILILIRNQIIIVIDVYKHMLIVTKHHFFHN
jgi:hypothetical protein